MIGNSFGTMPGGQAVQQLTISGGNLSAKLLTYGALLQDLRHGAHDFPLVLGLNSLADYLAHSPSFGITAGRFANRIANGRFELDGKAHQLDQNFLGQHLLHGGSTGFGKRVWTLTDYQGDQASFALVSEDMDMGFPGELRAEVTYKLSADDTLQIDFAATTDQPTLCNLTHHSYFNLSGEPTILDHELQLDADRYVPVDAQLIPTGETPSVAGTVFDFRARRPIRQLAEDGQVAHDHNFCLSDSRQPLRPVGRLWAPRSGLQMEIATTEPGVQLYTGSKLSVPVPGLDQRRYGAFAGLCLETQVWPDGPNHARFPSARLDPGTTYQHQVEYRFISE